MAKIGVGITTYNRPDYFKQCLESVTKLLPVVDSIWAYNDGSTKNYDVEIPEGVRYYNSNHNKGVAHAKNWLIKKLLKEGCDYIFLLEDDILIKSPKAVTEYVRLSDESGIEHMMFAHHGKANAGEPGLRSNGIDLYRNPIGAWCLYTKNVLEAVGLFDEHFLNAWEHVEHTWRIAKAGYTPPWGMVVADVTDSQEYLAEIPGSIKKSSINARSDHMANKINGLIYWQDKNPQDFPLGHILESLLKEEDAAYAKLGKKNPRYT